jgi:hypothetical protein
VSPAPSATTDGCNELDDDCDGGVDEDCATCVHVSPTGDDALANASDGATPFASVQAAIDFAASFRSVAKRVCVAAGAACGATFTYTGPAGADLTMRSGIDVLGGYESTTWTQCSDSTTELALPQATRGVYFPPDVADATNLDALTVPSVTIEGAEGVSLSNLTVRAGVTVTGSEMQIARSTVTGALSAVGSEVSVLDNCRGNIATNEGCRSETSTGRGFIGAVSLQDSPWSLVQGTVSNGVGVSGNSDGIVIRRNQLARAGFASCAGDAPWFVGNSVSSDVYPALGSSGDCHPVIEGSVFTVAVYNLDDLRIGVTSCSSAGGVASRCVFTKSSFHAQETGLIISNANGTVSGIECSGGSCARIDHSHFSGLSAGAIRGGVRNALGIRLESGRVLIDANRFAQGNGPVATGVCTAIAVTGAEARIQNNVVLPTCGGTAYWVRSIVSSGGVSEIFSNYLSGFYSITAEVDVRDRLENNVIVGWDLVVGYQGLPAAMHNNALHTTSGSLGIFRINGAIVEAETMPELEALFGASASGNLGVSCASPDGHLASASPCIDAGTPAGAPHVDFEGDLRDARPDIGPDEYVP